MTAARATSAGTGDARGPTRREVLRMFASAAAFAAMPGCFRRPAQQIVPYVRTPTGLAPGNPLLFATAVPVAGFGLGVLARSHEGRPTKIEGNPDHPASLGATDAFAQASLLGLYDPERSRTPLVSGAVTTWRETFAALADRVRDHRGRGGEGLCVLTGAVTSPTLAALLARLAQEMPRARLFAHEPLGSRAAVDGARAAFGEEVVPRLRLERAQVVFAIDADFLRFGPAAVRYARDFAAARRVRAGTTARARLYAAESALTITGSVADHRFALRPSEVGAVAAALHRKLVGGASDPRFPWLDAVARDLEAHRGGALVVAGDAQLAEVHAAVHAVNDRLGAVGRTVGYADPVETTWNADSIDVLAREIEARRVESLLVIGTNPAYSAPGDLGFADLLPRPPFSLHVGTHVDETAALCLRHAPAAHFLESWDDVRAFDGTATIVQPLIAPLFEGRTAAQIAAFVVEGRERSGYGLLREHWRPRMSVGEPFEISWRRALRDGVIAGTAAPTRTVRRLPGFEPSSRSEAGLGSDAVEVAFRPDPNVLDGRFADNAWLQELPRPLTKISWDNAALVSARTAARLGVAQGDVVRWTLRGRSIEAPVWIAPGHADGCVTMPLGYGRTRAGAIGTGVGFDAYRLRAGAAPWNDVGVEATGTGASHDFACTQEVQSFEGLDVVRSGTLAQFVRDPTLGRPSAASAASASLYPRRAWTGAAWAMSIDLGACIGCNACAVACVAENNIPAVGRDQVARGRILHWIRIDTYHDGRGPSPRTFHQPVPCMQCEDAPCEIVCPVGATVHSHEGLNEQVYNRCVGTRYCSNNCPWKVRRFNFLAYAQVVDPLQELVRNPDVTVRSRGVMEKCTYCVQRIDRARIAAKREGRPIRDGEVVTACQAACPTQAIVFGNRDDPTSRVAAEKKAPHDYALLGDLGARPRTTYLAHVGNPNPEVSDG